jgi:iron complex outermembrane recepter protein
MYQQYTATLYGQDLDNRGTYWYIGPTNQFILSPKWNLEVGGTYQTSVVLGQFLTIPVGSVRAAVAMKCLKNQGTLKLVVNDVFFTNQPGGDIRSLYNSTANWYSVLDTRVVAVAFGYRFNKGQSRALRTVGGSDSEKSRVK